MGPAINSHAREDTPKKTARSISALRKKAKSRPFKINITQGYHLLSF